MERLHRIRSYRQYAISMGLKHMIPTREYVVNLLAQVGADPKLADVVFKGVPDPTFQSTEEDDIP